MRNQEGIGLLALVLGIVILGLIGWGAFALYTGNSKEAADAGQQAEQRAEELTDKHNNRNSTLERAIDLPEE